MGTQQDFHIVKFTQVVVVDGDESQILQPLALHAVVNDVSQTIESLITGAKFFLGFLDGGGHTKTETTAFVDFNLNHFFSSLK